MSANLTALARRQGLDHNLLERLAAAAAETGAPSPKAMRDLAQEFLIGEATVLGVASFYDFLRKENSGKKAYVCTGAACALADTQDAVAGQLELSAEEIGEVCCLGRCHENAAFRLQGKNYSGKSPAEIKDIVAQAADGSGDAYPVGSNLKEPLLTAEFTGSESYIRLHQDLARREPADLLREVQASRLRGRGGAGFPVGQKWAACAQAEAEEKFVVCNADEGDPGSYSDRYLLQYQPHAVLSGMMAAGRATGAKTGILYVRAEYPQVIPALRAAIAALKQAGLASEDPDDGGLLFRFKLVQGAGAYICGEETALLASLEGRRPEVAARPPYPVESGLFGQPTVVNNVETFALAHALFARGGKAFAQIGTAASTGSKLVSLDSGFNTPGVYEVEMGTPLKAVIEDLGGGFRQPVKAIHVGGPLGGLVPASLFNALTLDFESFQSAGFLLGHASMVCLPADYPILKYILHLFEFCARESCGKCFPCRLGTTRGVEMFGAALNGKSRIDAALLQDLLATLADGSLCGLGGGLPLPVRNALTHFADELAPYFSGEVGP